MSLVIYNGSPRGKSSNSSLITSWFLEGYGNDDVDIRYLNKTKQHDSYSKEILNYNQILMVFPLYVDGMPGQVLNFFEILSSLKNKLKDKEITFIIHSGFSEGIQSEILEKYLNKYSKTIGFKNYGIVIIPGSEGFRIMPPSMTKKKRLAVAKLGASYINEEPYDDEVIKFLYGKEKTSKFAIIIYKFMRIFGLTNIYWNSTLKKNNARKKVFDTPYKDNPVPITSNAVISIRNSNK